MIHRRELLTGLGALIAAPAIVRATSLMPVRRPPLVPVWHVVRLSDWDALDVVDRLGGPLFEGSIGEYRGVVFKPDYCADLWFAPLAMDVEAIGPPGMATLCKS